jgi:hypothetical protein
MLSLRNVTLFTWLFSLFVSQHLQKSRFHTHRPTLRNLNSLVAESKTVRSKTEYSVCH